MVLQAYAAACMDGLLVIDKLFPLIPVRCRC